MAVDEEPFSNFDGGEELLNDANMPPVWDFDSGKNAFLVSGQPGIGAPSCAPSSTDPNF